ncbi:MAG: glutamine--fructose-6-phosphate transaminase (isomerizing) [Pseudomonadales bacterium]|jgi:glucosamine--fructose-6-phosphate aminotransferase (isomerizing)|nr:glutamine--fructose-6-phosphate transaminase (isomerizing) [Pseudomonadales bacterium]
MCGIVGYVGSRHAMPVLLEGLGRLEYRGYDSAGIALQRKDKFDLFKKAGRLDVLRSALPKRNAATCGIGHTRWATHGEPNDLNAHPHVDSSGAISIVHNGIIENAGALRTYLTERGHTFASDTDTEVLAALIADEFLLDENLTRAIRSAVARVAGTYGIVAMHARVPGLLVAARNGSPVVIGVGDNEMFVASDIAAIAPFTRQIVHLEDGEIATLTAKRHEIQDFQATITNRPTSTIKIDTTLASKGDHEHFTLKEIVEQPDAIRRTLSGRLDERFNTAHFGGLNLNAKELMAFKRIKILGCGSAYISGSIGASMIERLARIPTDAESAAEFRYRNPIIDPQTLYLAVSQSGETYDTLTAVQEIQRKGGTVLGIVNVVGSSIARQCGAGMYLHAGPEVAVVSTKTFACTLTAFALLALHIGRMRDVSPAEGANVIRALNELPQQIQSLIDRRTEFEQVAKKYADYHRAYFIGRCEGFGLAREGALKLKEISYIHAEAYPASELKHGPLALIDEQTPTFAIVPDDDLLAKNLSTLAEIKTRKGPVVAIGQSEALNVEIDDYIHVPRYHPLTDPILLLIPLQFLAYYTALARDCDVDQPRNLAKSVTVE